MKLGSVKIIEICPTCHPDCNTDIEKYALVRNSRNEEKCHEGVL